MFLAGIVWFVVFWLLCGVLLSRVMYLLGIAIHHYILKLKQKPRF